MSALLLVLAALAAPPEGAVVVVYAPDPQLTPRQAQLFEAHLLAEIAKRDGLRISTDTAARAQAPAECELERSCLAKLAQAAGGDLVVLARTASLGSARVVTLKRLRISTGEIEQSVTKSIDGAGGQGLLMALGPAVAELFPDTTMRAAAQPGVAELYIERWDAPPLPRWAFWTSTGATVAAFGAAGYFAWKKNQAEDEWAAAFGGDAVVDGETLRAIEGRASDAARNTNIALGAGVALAIGSGVVALFTDWSPELDREVLVGPGGMLMRF